MDRRIRVMTDKEQEAFEEWWVNGGEYQVTESLGDLRDAYSQAWQAACAWKDKQPREIICTKCGIREQKGIVPKGDF